MAMTARPARVGTLLALALSLVACGALRQNLKNQFVSFRGAWQCPSPGCGAAKMVRSNQGHREGDVKVSHVKMQPRVALVFYPGTPVDTFTAKVSCGGQSADVPAGKIRAPGSHKIQGQSDAWVVILKADDYSFGDCKDYRVMTHSTWENGKREYDEPGGIRVE
jgi:hypothetical protein